MTNQNISNELAVLQERNDSGRTSGVLSVNWWCPKSIFRSHWTGP